MEWNYKIHDGKQYKCDTSPVNLIKIGIYNHSFVLITDRGQYDFVDVDILKKWNLDENSEFKLDFTWNHFNSHWLYYKEVIDIAINENGNNITLVYMDDEYDIFYEFEINEDMKYVLNKYMCYKRVQNSIRYYKYSNDKLLIIDAFIKALPNRFVHKKHDSIMINIPSEVVFYSIENNDNTNYIFQNAYINKNGSLGLSMTTEPTKPMVCLKDILSYLGIL